MANKHNCNANNINGVNSWRYDGHSFKATTEDTVRVSVVVYAGVTLTNYTAKPMIRLASDTDATYEPYTETQALIPISAPLYYGDYIEVYADGTGQIVRERAKWLPPSTLNWREVTNNPNKYTTNIPSDILNNMETAKQGGKADAHSNIAISSSWGDLIAKSGVFCLSYDGYVAFSYAGTVDEFKTMLTQTNAYIIYKLKTPTTEPLTAEQVSEFMKLQTFKFVTHVTADGEVTTRYYCDNDSGDTVAMLQSVITALTQRVVKLEENSVKGAGLYMSMDNNGLNVSNGKQRYNFTPDGVVE